MHKILTIMLLTLLFLDDKSSAGDPLEDGEACKAAEDCISKNCSNNVCQPSLVQAPSNTNGVSDPSKKKDGELCIADAECDSGKCKTSGNNIYYIGACSVA